MHHFGEQAREGGCAAGRRHAGCAQLRQIIRRHRETHQCRVPLSDHARPLDGKVQYITHYNIAPLTQNSTKYLDVACAFTQHQTVLGEKHVLNPVLQGLTTS